MGRIAQLGSGAKRAGWMLTAPEKWLYRRGVLRVQRLALPDFLGIGLARSGTGWLWRNLIHHPEVQWRADREVGYFNSHFGRSVRSYASHFAAAGPGQRGDVTPGYAYLSPKRIEFVKALMPDAKVILLLREPLSRAWSEAMLHSVGKRDQPPTDFDWDEFSRSLIGLAQRADYVEILRRWEAVYSPDRIFVGFLDDIENEPLSVLRDLMEFLSLSTDVDWDSFPAAVKHNASIHTAVPQEYRELLAQIYLPRMEGMRVRFGKHVDAWQESLTDLDR